MSFPRYPAYKDSGVEWLGQVPAHWALDRLKRSLRSERNGLWGDEPKGDANDLPCVRVADFDRTKLIARATESTIRNVEEKDREGRLLSPNNLLIEKSGGGETQPVGCVVLYQSTVPAICSNFIARLELAASMSASFWRYFHSAMYASRINVRSIKQTSGIQNLDTQAYFDERAAFPPLDEQEAIARFLDRETAKIDALVAEQQRLIALLKEKRQAVISHAVTKGLNPKAPMKESGIDWLGSVPERWTVTPLRYIVESVGQGWSPQCESYAADLESEYGVLKVGAVNGGNFDPSENKKLPPEFEPPTDLAIRAGDLMISRANTRELVGSAAVAEANYPRLLLCDKLYRLRFSDSKQLPRIVCRYMATPIVREQIELGASGASASMLNISQSVILDLPIPVPPEDEMMDILEYCDRETQGISVLVKEAEEAVALLIERRAALVTAAVTGQIDVRGLASAEAA